MSFECFHESGHLEWDLARVRRHLYIRCNLITVAKFLCRGRRAVCVDGLRRRWGSLYHPILQNIEGSSIARLVLYSTSFSSFTYRENVCHGNILHMYSISTYHACTAYYTHVHAWCDATHVVVLALCVCHVSCACGTRVSDVWHACNTHGLFKLWVICTIYYSPTGFHRHSSHVRFKCTDI